MSVARGAPNAGHFYSNIVSPIKVDCQFVVAAADSGGLGITSLKSNGYVQNVYMHTSATPATGNPNPASGYAVVHMKQNFNHFLGMNYVMQPPVTGSDLDIDGTPLTAGVPYQITVVGAVPQPVFTVSTVADTAGSLASKYFTFSNQAGNNYVVYYIVAGLGSAPSLTGALLNYTAIQVSIPSGETANNVATATRTALAAASAVTISGATNAVIITGANANSNLQFAVFPAAQTSGFTVSAITFVSLAADWQHVGLPAGLTPAVGQSFIAIATGGSVGSGSVKALTNSAIVTAEVIGVSDASIATNSIALYGGAYVLVKFDNSSLAATAPTAGTIVSMSLYFDQSSVTVDGL